MARTTTVDRTAKRPVKKTVPAQWGKVAAGRRSALEMAIITNKRISDTAKTKMLKIYRDEMN